MSDDRIMNTNFGKVTKFYRWKVYFHRGHQQWLSFIPSLGTFFMVLYGFLVTYMQIPIDVWFFLISFPPTYVVVATYVGWWDLNRGAFATHTQMEWIKNPEWNEMKADVKEIKEYLLGERMKEEMVESVNGIAKILNDEDM